MSVEEYINRRQVYSFPTISALLQVKTMVMLTGIKAFEYRWQSFQVKYPISDTQRQIITQAMGRLVDNYATQEEIEADLPDALRILFHRLVDAYLNGCWAAADAQFAQREPQRLAPTMTPAMLAAAQRRQQPQSPTAASEADTYIVIDDNTAATIRYLQSRAVYIQSKKAYA